MFEELGITEEKYNELVKKVGIKLIFHFLTEFDEMSNKFRLLYYMDDNGIFVGRKRPKDHICMAIFESLPNDDKSDVYSYMEYLER